MSAAVIDGKAISAQIKDELRGGGAIIAKTCCKCNGHGATREKSRFQEVV